MRAGVLSGTNQFFVDRSTAGKVHDVFEHLLLPGHNRGAGFVATRGPAEATLLFTERELPIGPLCYSADTDLLLCYSVRYADRSLGALFLAGASLQPLLSEGIINQLQSSLFAEVKHRGGVIRHHTLTQIRTPRAANDIGTAARVFNECSRLREALAYGYPDHAAPRGGLLINAISLCGWKTHHAPDCTFFSCDDNFDLLVAVGFNDRGNPSEVINLTRPEVTLAFSSYEKL